MTNNKTIETLQRELAGSPKIREKIRENIVKRNEREMILNLCQLEFDFDLKQVTVSYYVKDRMYPESILSFEQLIALLG